MTIHVALLRAVNLASHNKVTMAELRALATDLGFSDAQTVLQSGNLVFRSRVAGTKLERLLEAEVRKRLGVETDFMLRTGEEWQTVVAGNPFRAEAKKDPAHLVVMFCKEQVPGTLTIRGARREVVRPKGREIYIYYPDGIGRSRLKIAGVRGTARNWNTVIKLAGMVADGSRQVKS